MASRRQRQKGRGCVATSLHPEGTPRSGDFTRDLGSSERALVHLANRLDVGLGGNPGRLSYARGSTWPDAACRHPHYPRRQTSDLVKDAGGLGELSAYAKTKLTDPSVETSAISIPALQHRLAMR